VIEGPPKKTGTTPAPRWMWVTSRKIKRQQNLTMRRLFVYRRVMIVDSGPRAYALSTGALRALATMVAALCATVSAASAAAQSMAAGARAAVETAASSSPGSMLASPSSFYATGQPVNAGQVSPGQGPSVPAPPTPAPPIPRVIPLDPIPAGGAPATSTPAPRVVRFPVDSTGFVPEHPTVSSPARSRDEVSKDVANLVEMVTAPEAEISLVEGQIKTVRTRRALSRIIVSSPLIADIELVTDQPGSRLFNLQGKSWGTTTLTMWDETDRPVTFLVRVSIDTHDLEGRIRQAFPGSEIKVRHVGMQVILDGQTTDSKTMSDILQLVTLTLMNSPSMRGLAGGGGGGGGGGGMSGGSMGGGGAGG
jgi:pilus assembly protein CpaC